MAAPVNRKNSQTAVSPTIPENLLNPHNVLESLERLSLIHI